MKAIFEKVTNLRADADVLAARRYGMIEVVSGSLVAVHLRPFPKMISLPEFVSVSRRYHARGRADRCLLYYNQPRRFPNYLAIRYVVSTRGTSFGTCRRALEVLEEIARIKRSDALLCDVASNRISDRLMRRWGWEAHKPQRWHRNFIKRFYGSYPTDSIRNTSV